MLLAVLLCSGASAQMPGTGKEKKSDLAARVPVDKKVIIGHLDNGFTYYIRDNRKPEDRIQFRLVSNAGSILERDDQQGLAHFCEHMAFNGIKGYPGNTMIEKLQQHGIEFGRGINAWTSFDETVYYVDMPASDPEMVRMGIEILDGWAGNILFDQKEIESERGVIHEEWRGGIGHGDRMRQKTFPTVFRGSLYADRLPIGKEEVIMNFKRQAIVDFFNDWYRPDLQAIVIVGDMQGFEYQGLKGAKAMEQRVKDVFGQHAKAANPKARPVFTIEGNKEPLVAIATDKEATSAEMAIMWKHAKEPVGTVGDYRRSLVNSLVTMMMNERFTELAERPTAPFMAAAVGRNGGFIGRYVREASDFTLVCQPKEGRIEEATSMLLGEMRRVDRHGFLASELERQKEELLASYTRMAKEADKTESDALASEYTRHFLTGEVIPGIRQEWRYAKEFVSEITLEECNALAASWITDENMVYYLTAPQRDDYRVPTEQTVRQLIADSRKAQTEPWVDTFEDRPLFTAEVPAAVPYKALKVNSALGYWEYECANGVRFVVKQTHYKDDEIMIASQSFGGTSLYGDEDCFLASNTASLIDACGLADFTASQLQKKLKGKSFGISPYISGEEQGFHGVCPPDELEDALQVIHLYYSAPRTDADVFARTTEQLRTQRKLVADNPQVAFAETFYRTAYPGYRRHVVVPTEEQIASLDPERALRLFRERFHDASGQVFFFVGNVSDAHVPLIARYLSILPADGRQRGETYVDRTPQFARGIVRAEAVKGIEKQGMLVVQGRMPEERGVLDAQSRIALEVLSNALGITTLEIIREKNGDAYSPSAGVYAQRLPRGLVMWQFSIGCDPAKIGKIERDCIAILKQYRKKGCDEKTLAKAKEQMIVNHGTHVQSNGYWIGQLGSAYTHGESADYLLRYEEMVRSVTVEHVKALAQKYFDIDNYVAVSLRPEEGAQGMAE